MNMLLQLLLVITVPLASAQTVIPGATYKSVAWSDCSDSKLYTVAFNAVDSCFPLTRFQNPRFVSSYQKFCNSTREIPTAVAGTNLACSAYGLWFLGAYWCTIGAGVSPATTTVDLSAMSAASCQDGAFGLSNLQAAAAFIAQPPSEHRVTVTCDGDNGVPQISVCSDAANPVAPFVVASLRINFTSTCVAGFAMTCSYCQPYLDPSTVSQPYYFLLVAGLQLIVLVCAQLFLFDGLSSRIRRRVDRYYRERKPAEANHPLEFTDYVVAELLQHSRRLRLNMTLRRRDGRRSIERLLKIFQRENKRPITAAEWQELTHPKYGVVLTDASYSREQCISVYQFVIQQVLEELEVTRLADFEQRLMALEMEWFWRDVTRRGARAYGGSLTQLSNAFKRHWALIGARRLVFHMQHQTQDAADDVNVVLYGEQDEVEYVVATELGERVSAVHGYLYVLVKQVRPIAKIEEIKMMLPNGTPLTWHRDETVGDVIRRSDDAMKDDPVYQQYWTGNELREGQARTLLLRFHSFRILPEGGFSPQFRIPTSSLLIEVRDEFLQDCDFIEPRFDPKHLRRDTNDVLTMLLDNRFASSLADKLLLLAGEMTVFDYEVRDEFWVRDDIPQITTVAERKAKNAETQLENEKALGSDTLLCLECFLKPDDEGVENASLAFPSSTEPITDEKSPNGSLAGGVATRSKKRNCQKLPVTDPDTNIFKPAADHPIITFCQNQIVDKAFARMVYNEAFELLVTWDPDDAAKEQVDANDQKKSRAPIFSRKKVQKSQDDEAKKKRMRRGIMRFNPFDRALLREALADMYTTIENRLAAANCDRNAVYVPLIVAEHREIIETFSHVVPIVTKEQQVILTMYSINVHVLLVQVAFGVYFFAECVKAGKFTTERQSSANSFTGYEVTFFRFLNSGTPVALLGATLTNIGFNGERRELSWYFLYLDWLLLAVTLLMVVPPIATHIVPGTVLFVWVLLICIVCFVIPCVVMYHFFVRLRRKWIEEGTYEGEELRKRHRKLKVVFTAMMLWTQFSAFVLMTALFQSTFNWAHLFYHRTDLSLTYPQVVEREWNSRTPECYFSAAFSSAPNILQFLSSIVG